MTDTERRSAAAQFAADWRGRGDEKQETQAFWLALLQKVYGVDEPEKYRIKMEVRPIWNIQLLESSSWLYSLLV